VRARVAAASNHSLPQNLTGLKFLETICNFSKNSVKNRVLNPTKVPDATGT
jgi:hypothetical protein